MFMLFNPADQFALCRAAVVVFMLLGLADQRLRHFVAAVAVGMLFGSAGQLALAFAVAAVVMGVLALAADLIAFLIVAAVVVGMLALFAGQFAFARGVAAVVMGMLRSIADQFFGLLIAAVAVRMCFFLTSCSVCIAAVVMFMLFLFACQFFYSLCIRSGLFLFCFRSLTVFCRFCRLFRVFDGSGFFAVRRAAFGFLLLTDQDFLFLPAALVVLMKLMLFQLADKFSLLVVAVIIMYMNHIVRQPADQDFFPVLILFVAVLCMFMHFILTVQHLHLVRHRLTVQLQKTQCTQSDACSQAQKDHCSAPALCLFLQELPSP